MTDQHHALREFLTAAEKLGFTFDGYDGNGHPRLKHDSGLVTSVSRTPSDWRSRRNELARLERISGRKLPRSNAAHYTHRRVTQSNFHQSPTEAESIAKVNALVDRTDSLRCRFAELVNEGTREAAAEARKLVRKFEELREQLRQHHRIIAPLEVVSE